jgi:hypothetical protein
MRPKKRVLIFSPLELGTLPFQFAIETRGFKAAAAHSIADFCAALDGFAPDVVLILYAGVQRAESEQVAQCASARGIRIIVVLQAKRAVWHGIANALVMAHQGCAMAETLERLRIFAAHKTGPKKPSGAVVPAAAEAVLA